MDTYVLCSSMLFLLSPLALLFLLTHSGVKVLIGVVLALTSGIRNSLFVVYFSRLEHFPDVFSFTLHRGEDP